MLSKFQAIIAVILIINNLVGFFPKDQNTIRGDYTISSLTPTWTTGIISDTAATSRTLVGDLNHDSVTDIATCSNGFVYLLNYISPGIYDTAWYSEHVACSKITAADRDADGSLQLFIATSDGKVVVFSGTNHQHKDEFTLPGAASASDIAVANVDGDPSLEIVLVRSTVTWVYDASTYTLEWTATGFGGNQVAIGDIDNDTQSEIVVNGNPAHILNATTQSQEWGLSGGFGVDMSLGDVDGDNFPEIAYTDTANNIYVFDAGTMTEKWHLAGSGTLYDIIVADTNGDDLGEVIIGNHGRGSVFGYKGGDGTLLWTIPNPEYSAYGLAAGDTDGDGEKEIVWGGGVGLSSQDVLLVGSWVSETVEWTCDDLDGPLFMVSGDVDLDGSNEIIMASKSTNTVYDGGKIRVYDGTSHQVEWSTDVGPSFYRISHLAIGQMDGDAALEIVVGAENWYDTRIKVFDGITHAVDWESPVLGDYEPLALIVANLDADAVDEIIVGLSTDNVQVIHGLTNIIQWESGPLDGDIRDLDLGDLDGDGILDLVIQTKLSVYIYEVGTWTQKLHRTISNGWRLTIANADLSGSGELLLVTMDGSLNTTLIGWDGVTYSEISRRPLGVKIVKDLVVNDLDSDGSQELIFIGNQGSYSTRESYLSIADPRYPDYWEYHMDRRWDTIYNIALIDVDTDGQMELLLSSNSVIQINEISKTIFRQSYIPMVIKNEPRSIYGSVTDNGEPAPGVTLDLRFYNGSSTSTIASTITTADGSYSFPGIPSLTPGQYYHVRYDNPGDESDRLLVWITGDLTTFEAGSEVELNSFDIANVSLISPTAGAIVSLPQEFQWIPRPASPMDSYEFDIFDPIDLLPFYWTDPLGYVGNYTMTTLPDFFSNDELYGWTLWIYSPDGGVGVSYELRPVTFTDNSTGMFRMPSSPLSQEKIMELIEMKELIR